MFPFGNHWLRKQRRRQRQRRRRRIIPVSVYGQWLRHRDTEILDAARDVCRAREFKSQSRLRSEFTTDLFSTKMRWNLSGNHLIVSILPVAQGHPHCVSVWMVRHGLHSGVNCCAFKVRTRHCNSGTTIGAHAQLGFIGRLVPARFPKLQRSS